MAWRYLAASAALFLLAGALIGGCVLHNTLHADVTPRSLYLSVVDATPSIDVLGRSTDTCGPEGGRWEYVCQVPDAEASSSAIYRVTVRPGSSCWDARRVGRATGMPKRASGCVRRKHA